MAGSYRHLCVVLALCIFVQTCGQQTSCGAANKTSTVATVYVFNQLRWHDLVGLIPRSHDWNWVDRLQEVDGHLEHVLLKGKRQLERTGDLVSLVDGSCLANPCDAKASCTNTPTSAASCSCKAGYTGDGLISGTGCSDIDSCLANLCHAKATCKDNPAPALDATCTCSPGYRGDGLVSGTGCSEIDACLANPCDAKATCKDNPAPALDATCTCKTGYNGDGLASGTGCLDTDACLANPCDAKATCKDNPAPAQDATCICNPGYTGDGLAKWLVGGSSCSDMDACLANPCHTKATCSDNSAPALDATCTCYPGYIGDGLANGSGCSGVWLKRKSSWVVDSAGPPWVDNGVTYDATKALDGDQETFWNPIGAETSYNDWYIVLDLTVPKTLTRIAVNNLGDTTHDIAAFKLLKSQDGITWEHVVSVTDVETGTGRRQEFGSFEGTARYWKFVVTQTHSGWQPYLTELDLYGLLSGVNVALGKTGFQTSYHSGTSGSVAVDGNTATDYFSGSCTHTITDGEANPAWWVDLGQSYAVDRVVIFNRQDCCAERLNPFNIHIGDSTQVTTNPRCGGDIQIDVSQPAISVSCEDMKGRYVGVRLPGASRVLTLCEVQIVPDYPMMLKNLGCWEDQYDRAISMMEGTDPRLDGHSYLLRTDPIKKCYQVAKDRGYKVFAVQDSGQCFSSATAADTYRKYGPSTGCAEGEGGSWSNDVYEIIDA